MRIHKALSDAGILSRRKAEALISAGKISVNGHPATIGQDINPARDVVVVEGVRVEFPRKKATRCIMLYKPRGYVTTLSDELDRRCVADLVADAGERLYPIGRLDKDSEGLLLLTNDGALTNLITHPSHKVPKTYRVTLEGLVSEDALIALQSGVELAPGEITEPATVGVIETTPERTVLRMTITEGKNRQIRRMCETQGLVVKRLKRISVGPLKLGMLQPGKWREVTPAELTQLRNATGGPSAPVNRPAAGRRPRRDLR